jgi:hypothetical protein
MYLAENSTMLCFPICVDFSVTSGFPEISVFPKVAVSEFSLMTMVPVPSKSVIPAHGNCCFATM